MGGDGGGERGEGDREREERIEGERECGPVGMDRPSQVLGPSQWVGFNPLARGNLVILPN